MPLPSLRLYDVTINHICGKYYLLSIYPNSCVHIDKRIFESCEILAIEGRVQGGATIFIILGFYDNFIISWSM